jgi:hypothetical protein
MLARIIAGLSSCFDQGLAFPVREAIFHYIEFLLNSVLGSRFRNDLPDSTAQPKLMHINTDKDRWVILPLLCIFFK